jgi:membrane-anchored protein YejM (alkaline phosphatase superfamily)
MSNNPYLPPTTPTSPITDGNKLDDKVLKSLKNGYFFSLFGLVIQVILPILYLIPMDKPISGFGLPLFVASILGPAMMIHGLGFKIGKRLLVLLGLLIFPINIVVTVIIRNKAKVALANNGYTVNFISAKN